MMGCRLTEGDGETPADFLFTTDDKTVPVMNSVMFYSRW